MLEVRELTKRYGRQTVVDRLSFTVHAGRVTGFLGPNGAGKTTTMRMLLGLVHPDSGSALVGGRPFSELRHPMCEVGAVLDARAAHPGRTAEGHLMALASSNAIARRRVGEVLEMTGLAGVAGRRVGGFSLGMAQRLSVAAALLGDPGVLLFDEPVNGLDPEGVRWIRDLMRGLAAEGRTVFVSSHLMSEMEMTADHLVVVGRGRLIADLSMREFCARSSRNAVRVRSPHTVQLVGALRRAGGDIVADDEGTLLVTGLDSERVAEAAAGCGAMLHELSVQRASLEEAFMELTGHSVEYRGTTPPPL
ncbi:ATP-binding cassette domain-containing protein [Streptomyces sp. ISL-10]|uniref:ABC transporter ATP-binding protein n=1 Tax=Streptomyces sp. ISL-10 TaxID=2819172 RepID=UPI001BEA6837|nr:ATP-binding cassette domain-containing protein [Streptomyces sp. ISL-10]MBT2369335.1 ATP-binding cassette domain-containing protein [Streptomyces sp. ISL-10]